MNTLSVEGWHKPNANASSIPIGLLNFRVSEKYHLLLEQAEDEMELSHEPERFIDVDMEPMELEARPNVVRLQIVNCGIISTSMSTVANFTF